MTFGGMREGREEETMALVIAENLPLIEPVPVVYRFFFSNISNS